MRSQSCYSHRMTTTKVITVHRADIPLALFLATIAYLALAHHIYVWLWVWVGTGRAFRAIVGALLSALAGIA